ncbi:MAG: ParB N-terminal domain-containing protein [Syntrophobacteraceae bacterium]|jgi:ParB family chromosome partitioning protein
MGEDIREIEVRKISPNRRIVCSAECIEEIEHAIKSRGHQEPIHICFKHDSFRILDGEKRFRACKRLGMNTIRAVVIIEA